MKNTQRGLGLVACVALATAMACSAGGSGRSGGGGGGGRTSGHNGQDSSAAKDMASPKDLAGSGSSGPVSCLATTDPCGGDISGMWAVAKDCGESAPDGCPSYSLTLTETPTRIFNFVDGQFSYQAMGVFRTKETFNRSCVSVASCSELTDPAQNIACLDQGSTQCVCSIETDATGTSSGSFQTQGANVTLTYDDGTNESYVYCMKNDRMYFFFEDGTHLAMRRCTVSGCD